MNSNASDHEFARQLGLRFAPNLAGHAVSTEFVENVPIAFARTFGVIGIHDDIIDSSPGAAHGPTILAVKGSSGFDAADVIGRLFGRPLDILFAPADQITAAINRGHGVTVYEAVYGASHESVPPDSANPLPLILPAIELLNEIGEAPAADRIRAAVCAVLTEGRVRTRDIGGQADTKTKSGFSVVMVVRMHVVTPSQKADIRLMRRLHQKHVDPSRSCEELCYLTVSKRLDGSKVAPERVYFARD